LLGPGPPIDHNGNGTFAIDSDYPGKMPTLFRFLVVVVVLAAIAGGAVVYLANFVSPHTREMTIRIPASKLAPTP
jgi:hypothetical protein